MSYTVKRFDSIEFGRKPKLIDDVECHNDIYIAKVVDDSTYIPNGEFVRHHLASGGSVGEGIYDFVDGKDNGFTPTVRGLGFDMAEIDNAQKYVIDSANKKVQEQKNAEIEKNAKERSERILNAMDSMAQSPATDTPTGE